MKEKEKSNWMKRINAGRNNNGSINTSQVLMWLEEVEKDPVIIGEMTQEQRMKMLTKIKTCDLVNEVTGREGVKHQMIGPEDRALIIYQNAPDDVSKNCIRQMVDGPAIILMVID